MKYFVKSNSNGNDNCSVNGNGNSNGNGIGYLYLACLAQNGEGTIKERSEKYWSRWENGRITVINFKFSNFRLTIFNFISKRIISKQIILMFTVSEDIITSILT